MYTQIIIKHFFIIIQNIFHPPNIKRFSVLLNIRMINAHSKTKPKPKTETKIKSETKTKLEPKPEAKLEIKVNKKKFKT